LPAAETRKVLGRFALTPKCTEPCFRLAPRPAISSAKATLAISYLAQEVEVNGVQVHACEGLVIENEELFAIKALTDTELVLVVAAQ
jgi:hypothetical protein